MIKKEIRIMKRGINRNERLQDLRDCCMKALEKEKDPLCRQYIMGILCGITIAEFADNERVLEETPER